MSRSVLGLRRRQPLPRVLGQPAVSLQSPDSPFHVGAGVGAAVGWGRVAARHDGLHLLVQHDLAHVQLVHLDSSADFDSVTNLI